MNSEFWQELLAPISNIIYIHFHIFTTVLVVECLQKKSNIDIKYPPGRSIDRIHFLFHSIRTISFEVKGLRTQIKFNSILKSENEVIDVSFWLRLFMHERWRIYCLWQIECFLNWIFPIVINICWWLAKVNVRYWYVWTHKETATSFYFNRLQLYL